MLKSVQFLIAGALLTAAIVTPIILYYPKNETLTALYSPIDPKVTEGVRQARSLQKAGKLDEAFLEFERYTKLGHPTAMFHLAKAYTNGWGVKPDLEEARTLLLKAVQYKFDLRGESAYKLGRLYEQAAGEDCQKIAVAWFMKALQWNYQKAHRQLAIHYEQGLGVERDLMQALEHYDLAAKAGFETVSLRLARLLVSGRHGLVIDNARAQLLAERAIRAYEVKASKGSGTSAKVLGRLYRDGEFVTQSNTKALYWFRRASLLGDPGGMHEFALLATTEMDDKKPLVDEALDWLSKAIELHHSGAMTTLGRFHLKEKHGLKKSGAIAWFEKGVNAGHGGSMEELARLKASGKLVKKDVPGALSLARRGTDLGHRGAANFLRELLSEQAKASPDKTDTTEKSRS